MNESITKYGDRKDCLTSICSGKRTPDDRFCSSYSCHYSRDFKPGEAWKFYYRQQKLQECDHEKQYLLKRLSRCYDKDFMQCVIRGLRKIEEDPSPATVPHKFEPDFYARPWQQQFVPPLQEPPCPIHGFDRVSQNRVCEKVRLYPPHCSKMVHCCEPCEENTCSHSRRPQVLVNPLIKYTPAPVYVIQPCIQLPNTHSYMGVRQPCLPLEPPWCIPQFCCSHKQIQKPCKD